MSLPSVIDLHPRRMTSWPGLVFWLLVCFGTGTSGAFFGPGEWFRSLNKPEWNPPDWVFGPVWTMLYIMMAFSIWLFSRKYFLAQIKPQIAAFMTQLILNGAWSWIFFKYHSPGIALIDIALLWIAIVITIILFFQKSTGAAVLLLPYLTWVSFASFLNFSFWRLNL